MMARAKTRAVHELEAGTIAFLAQPRKSDDEIAHLLMRLRSESGRDRVIVIGRKRLTDRFWALVYDKLPETAEEIGSGQYRIYEHDGHSHLAYDLEQHVDEQLRRAAGLRRAGGFIVTVMNPDPTVWGTDPQEELFPGYIMIPTPFPPQLQERFDGRKYAKLDTVEFLDYPGAELVLITE